MYETDSFQPPTTEQQAPLVQAIHPRTTAESPESSSSAIPKNDYAPCVGQPELFAPTDQNVTRIKEAKAICRSCLVREECLEYSLVPGNLQPNERRQIWGGYTASERLIIIGQRATARLLENKRVLV